MKAENKKIIDELRRKAVLKSRPLDSEEYSKLTESDTIKLLHELEVHQIELELQNEELEQARQEERLISNKFSDLYEFSPSGYFSLTKDLIIKELNLNGSKMLGIDRKLLKNKRLDSFISEAKRPQFIQYVKDLFSGKQVENCEIEISLNGKVNSTLLIAGIIEENGRLCFITALDISKMKAIESSLTTSELMYRYMFLHNPQPMWIFDLETLKILEANNAAQHKYGYSAEEFCSLTVLDIRPTDDIPLLYQALESSKNELNVLGIYRHKKKNGEIFYVELTSHDIIYRNRTARHVLLNDVTEIFVTQKTLKKEIERNSFFVDLFSKESDLCDLELFNEILDISVKITESKIGFFHQVDENQQYVVLTTWNREAKENCELEFESHYPLSQAGIWADCIRQKKPIIYNYFTADTSKNKLPAGHTPIHRLMSIPILIDGRVRYVFGLGNKAENFTDFDIWQIQSVSDEMIKILKKREVESRLRSSEERFNQVAETSGIWVWETDETGLYTYTSAKTESILGYSPDEIIGKKYFYDFFSPSIKEEYKKSALEKFSRKETFKDFINPNVHKNGNIVVLETSGFPVISEFGELMGYRGADKDITSRTQMEEALRESEIHFRTLANSGQALIWTSGVDMKCDYFNQVWLDFTGRSLEQELGNGWAEGVHPDDLQRCINIYDSSFKKKVKFSMEYRIRHHSGEYRWIMDDGTPRYDSKGQFIGYIGHCLEITERKLAEHTLLESEKRFRKLFENMAQGVVYQNKNGEITVANSSAERILGINFDQMRGRSSIDPLWHTIHEDGTSFPGETHPAMVSLRTGRPDSAIMGVFNPSKGKYSWIKVASIPEFEPESDEPYQVFTTFEDITQLRELMEELNQTNANLETKVGLRTQEITQAMESLRESEERFHSMFFNHSASMLLINPESGLIVDANKAADSYYGFNFNRADRLHFSEIKADQMDDASPLTDLEKLREMNYSIMQHRLATGEFRTVEVHLSPIKFGGEELFFAIVHDITERKVAEEMLKNARVEADLANRAKSEFLSRMSHELRTPMNSILGFAQLLEMGNLNPSQKKGIGQILKSGKHLLELINEVLNISRIESGRLTLKIESIKLVNIIREALDIINPHAITNKTKVSLVESPNNLLFVKGDQQRLRQVLINLLTNAVKYNKEGGSVVIHVNVMPQNDSGTVPVRISIKDTGFGISSDDIQKIFNPFERIGAEKTNIEGTGLGLSVVKQLITAMEGVIGVESKQGEGSTFWIELPLCGSVLDGDDRSEPSKRLGRLLNKKGKILYVEDNVSNIELVREILSGQPSPVELITTRNGSDALGMALANMPDLILLDLNLQDLQGHEVLQLLMEQPRTKSIPVIVLSAEASPAQIENLIKLGARNYLIKPFDVSEFLFEVNSFLPDVD